MTNKIKIVLTGLLVGLTTVCVPAQQLPFFITASTTAGVPPLTVSAGGSNLLDFFSNLVNTEAQFTALDGRAYDGIVTFQGVPNAITFTTNAAGTNVTLGFTPIGVTKVFTGATADDVDTLINDFFQEDGLDVLSRFLKAIAAQSAIAVTDGNPNSATAVAANGTFINQGFTSADEIAASLESSSAGSSGAGSKPRFGGLAIGFNSGHFKAGGFEGETVEVSLTALNFGLGDRVRLILPGYLSYLKVAGAQVFGTGMNVVLPIRVLMMSPENPWSWRVTPLGGVSVRASEDLGSGALLWQAGVANTIDYRINQKLVVCMINQITMHRSIPLAYGEYTYDPQIDQQIAKNGLRLVTPFTRRLIGDVFVIDTRFLKAAAVKSFETVGASLSLRASKSFNLTVGGNYDTGNNYKAWSLGLSSAWRW